MNDKIRTIRSDIMKLCTFTVPGRAIPAVRMTQRSKFTKQAKRYLAYKNKVAWIARSKYKKKPASSDVKVEVDIYLRGGVQGDIDNYFKAITDSLNKIVYEDDRQVKEMVARKIDCESKDDERVEVEVYKLY